MRMPLIPLCSVTLLLMVPANACRADSLTEEVLKEDGRLSKRVTFTAPHIQIADLLEQLSRQTGVDMSASERDGAANEQVFIAVKDVPLSQVMNGLWSLMSYKGAAWDWAREGDAAPYRYRLARPLAARQFAPQLGQWVQEQFEQEVSDLIKGSKMAPEARKAFIERFVTDWYGYLGEEKHSSLVDYFTHRATVWKFMEMFEEMFTPEERRQILRGTVVATVPEERLSERAKAYLVEHQATGIQPTVNADGSRTLPGTPFGAIRFETRRVGAEAVPTLDAWVAGSAEGYSGGRPLQQIFEEKMLKLWGLPGDSTSGSQSSLSVTPPAGNVAAEPGGDPEVRVLERRCAQLASSPVSILARLPVADISSLEPPWNRTIKDYLRRMRDYCLLSKWRDDLILITTTGWYLKEGTQLPWSFVKRMRRLREAGKGLLPWAALTESAAVLNSAQLQRMETDFPEVKLASSLQGLLALLHRSPALAADLQSERGVAVSRLMPALAGIKSYSNIRDGVESGRIAAVRLVVHEEEEGEVIRRRLFFQMLSPENTLVSALSFEQTNAPRRAH